MSNMEIERREWLEETVTVKISGIPISRGKTVVTYKDGIKTVTQEDIHPDDPIFSAISPDFIPIQDDRVYHDEDVIMIGTENMGFPDLPRWVIMIFLTFALLLCGLMFMLWT